MKLLLKEDVPGVGVCGDEVQVKDGYGRNFLIPNGKALLATPKNLKQFNHQKSIVQARVKKVKVGAEAQVQEIEKVTCTFKKKAGDNGKLFGTVTTQEISESLRGHGIELDRRKIQLKEPIKSLGDFEVSVKLHPEVTATIKITVIRDAAEPVKAPESVKASESAEAPVESVKASESAEEETAS